MAALVMPVVEFIVVVVRRRVPVMAALLLPVARPVPPIMADVGVGIFRQIEAAVEFVVIVVRRRVPVMAALVMPVVGVATALIMPVLAVAMALLPPAVPVIDISVGIFEQIEVVTEVVVVVVARQGVVLAPRDASERPRAEFG